MEQDTLVSAIFETVNHADATPHERNKAIVRAGRIAEAYLLYGNSELAEKVFASLVDPLKDDKNFTGLSIGSH
jgi:hypothetical protein